MGGFNKNLQNLATTTVDFIGEREKRLKAEAEEEAAGTVFGTREYKRLRGGTEELEKASLDPEATPEQRQQAREALERVQAEASTNPHYPSALRRLQVQNVPLALQTGLTATQQSLMPKATKGRCVS